MLKPVVAIVGRPNVGKSTFFNKVVGRRISIEQDEPGVTRDRVYADARWLNREFTLIDTGGLDPSSEDVLLSQMREQTKLAIEMADVIVFMIDGKEGLTHTDDEIAQILRRSKKPVVMVVNKIDTFEQSRDVWDYYELGFRPIPISSVNSLNLGDLLDEIVQLFPAHTQEYREENIISVSIIGRPNVGKSSLVNKLLGENRVIVSNIPGTTREAIDTELKVNDKTFRFIDTAGVRRKRAVADQSIERYSVLRSFHAIDRSDIVILMVDASEGYTEQDKKIVGYAHEAGKGILVLVNKWDLIDKGNRTYREWQDRFYQEFPFLRYAMVEMISVLENSRVSKIIPMLETIDQNRARRIPTGQLNDLLHEIILMHPLPQDKGRSLKIFYATQSETKPPTFVLFINDESLMHFSYLRYLENRFREAYEFTGTPIHFVLKERTREQV
ncbi:MAG TPA: ribosome biogenesis GTPase Der [Tissierellia bacterium]|nr:ribosome biogenesis GTPase Der [Tissierellia bacterium]